MHALELKIPPVALTLFAGAAMWFISAGAPSFAWSFPFSRAIAFVAAGAGGMIAGVGFITFRRAGTSVNPIRPQAAGLLVATGIYRFTRNPMYLGLLFGLAAWGVFLGNLLAWIPVPPFVLYLNRFQIVPEERALGTMFGAEFNDYTRKVRRWL